jgi:tartrate dehydratase alpha subunit/fumarate hydratase class I-like protein
MEAEEWGETKIAVMPLVFPACFTIAILGNLTICTDTGVCIFILKNRTEVNTEASDLQK